MRALLLEKDDSGVRSRIADLPDDSLPEGEVTVAVRHSTLNYKDGLVLNGLGGLVRTYPHVPGVDFSGVVESSSDPRWSPGDEAILTGWRVGESRWGGFSTRARVKADWLVRVPPGLTLRQAMAIGTAGLTAMLAIQALEAHGLRPGQGPVLVTGAAGGVGSVAVTLLAQAGYEVAAVTGRPETEGYLRDLGATRIVPRSDLSEPTPKPMESETWAACVDAVGGTTLARVMGQLRHRSSCASVGNAAGIEVPLKVIPFLLRGVNLLGIDSVMSPLPEREAAWARLARDLPLEKLDAMTQAARLEDLPGLGRRILEGGVKGRVVVDL